MRDMATKAVKKPEKKPAKKAGKPAAPSPRALDLGIPADKLNAITAGLSRLLADTYTLYLKTHNYHWNVTGPQFNTLHTMFETQYTELALAVDEIAERLRALGAWAPGTYTEFARLSTVKEADGIPSAEAMVADLAADQARSSGRRGLSSRWPRTRRTNRRPTFLPSACRSMKRRRGCCGR
jgi:starvation-inducible DNA-binding protein